MGTSLRIVILLVLGLGAGAGAYFYTKTDCHLREPDPVTAGTSTVGSASPVTNTAHVASAAAAH